uniref:Uncharacterized protein n=1 Tax=Globodera pallida TaxID=36090 RepID=A0A183BX75_GLOPA
MISWLVGVGRTDGGLIRIVGGLGEVSTRTGSGRREEEKPPSMLNLTRAPAGQSRVEKEEKEVEEDNNASTTDD